MPVSNRVQICLGAVTAAGFTTSLAGVDNAEAATTDFRLSSKPSRSKPQQTREVLNRNLAYTTSAGFTAKARAASRKKSSRKPFKQFVLITGLSGSGKGSVLKAFEDLGFYCVDNLPVHLLPEFADLCRQPGSHIDRAAVVVDIREGEALSQLPAIYERLAHEKPRPSLVFLEASDDALVRRFEETRRPHPLGRHLPVREGIRIERMLLKPMR
ncbi:MAG TPA: RNase adapter RapZ, partial [Terriglobia bacterium]|nr:RNase adapter RapZ [Terriglobia bacterium]